MAAGDDELSTDKRRDREAGEQGGRSPQTGKQRQFQVK